jgi:hypothetical protein
MSVLRSTGTSFSQMMAPSLKLGLPDGRTLYFTSARDGHYCFWGQRLDAVFHRPEGEAFAVEHLHGRASYAQKGWSAAGGRLAMVLNEGTGSIWMMSRSQAR